MEKKKTKVVPLALQELLEVELRLPALGKDMSGNYPRQVLTRERFDIDGNEFKMRVIRIVKPAGLTMAQYTLLGGKGSKVEEQSESLANDIAIGNQTLDGPENPGVHGLADPDETPDITVEGNDLAAALGVDSVIGENPEEEKSIMDMDYGELKALATERGITYKGNIAKKNLITMLIEG